jgi:hypothetical protein
MAKNPFGKSRPATQPYAIYRAGDLVWHVCKTYKQPKSETGDLYARWFVWAKSPMTYGDFEGGDTYASEVRNYGRTWSRQILSGWTSTPAAYRCPFNACRVPLADRKRMMHR